MAKTIIKLFALLLLIVLVFQGSFCFCSGVCKVRNAEQLESGIKKGKTSFIVREDVDLSGRLLVFPDPAKITFKGGSLNNGTMRGSFELYGVEKGSLSVAFAKGSQILNRIPVFSAAPAVNSSLLSACIEGASLEEDIIVGDAVELKGSIYGNGHTLRGNSAGNSTITLTNSKKSIVLQDLTIVKDFEKSSINHSYAVYCTNSSNIQFDDCKIVGRLYYKNDTFSDSPELISENIALSKCCLYCDLSDSPQGFQYGQDHLTFCSVKNVSITDCEIVSKNVNRVLKTTAYFKEDVYEKAVNCCDGVVFKRNKVSAESDFGKQFWDFFCGTVNAVIEDNDIDIKGFYEVFEDKAFQDKYRGDELIESTIAFVNNRIRSKNSSLFLFRGSPRCDSFVFKGNECHLSGENKNRNTGFVRSSGSYLQGYKSCSIVDNRFYWEDEAAGLMFSTMNFDCLNTTIENNFFHDVYRVNVASSGWGGKSRVRPVIDTFCYRNNIKEYTSAYYSPMIEIAFEGVQVNDVDIEISADNSDDYYVSVNTDAEIQNLRFKSSGKTEKAICVLSDKVLIKSMNLPQNLIKKGRNWHYRANDAE